MLSRLLGVVALLLLVITGLLAAPAIALALYDVDFDEDLPGTTPAFDTGPFPRSGPSSCLSCELFDSFPVVVPHALGLTSQPVLFGIDPEARVANEQLGFDVGLPGRGRYQLDLDLSIGELVGTPFTVFLDLPSIFPVDFWAGGFVGALGVPRNEVLYTAGVPFHLTMEIDFDARESTVTIGDRSFAAPLLDRYTRLAGARLAMRSPGFVAADDFLLVAVPEPRAALLTLLGVAFAGARMRRAGGPGLSRR